HGTPTIDVSPLSLHDALPIYSYGVGFGDRGAFATLLRAVGSVPGIERVRFTSPHPAAFSDDVIAAMAQTPTVMPQLHMPLQSGSDRKSTRLNSSHVKISYAVF